LDSFPAHRVLVLGDVMLDEYLTGDCSRISPEAPVPVVSVTSSRAVLGGAANTAGNITSLGGRAVLIGRVGDDEAGRRLTAMTGDAGIEFVPIREARPTIRKVRVVGQQQQLLRLDYETSIDLDADVEARILAAARSHLAECSIVVMSDYAKGCLTERLCQQLLDAAHELGKLVIVDPRPQHARFYVGCDYLTPNWKESLGLAGLSESAITADAVAETGRHIAERLRAHVLLTLGGKGMTFYNRDDHSVFDEPALAKEVFDVSGAGDTVVAAFALAIAAGCDHRDAVRLANRAAGIVVAKLGTATVSPSELLRDQPDRTLVKRHELAGLSNRLRSLGKRIATLNGSFDILHAGHLYILHEARRQADVLIVGLNSDESVRAYKGPDRPFIGETDRARLLMALRDVDYVHVFDESTPIAFLEQVRPDVHVNGAEYGEQCVEAPAVRAGGGRVHLVDRLPDLSTSGLIDRILRGSPLARA
jgi:D-beta-D-heptose 7-phosphate kinase/D-beta-D-heptose 1-phosphate adenosyltransferase